MACPYFLPTGCDEDERPAPARAPLGRLQRGECHAQNPPLIPDGALMREYCNFGYGRGNCPHFPVDSVADAVRFSPRGAGLIYILEARYSPVEFGPIEQANALVRRQAEVLREHLH